jgi:hypothetical protein
MSKFTVVHEINCNAETFWKMFFDQAFNERLFVDGLGFKEFKVIEERDGERELVRKATGVPKLSLPGPVAKLLGDNFRYTEEGRFDKATQVWTWKIIPGTMADKIRQEGTLRLEPIGDSKVRRIADLVLEAKVFGIGGLIESSVEKQLRDSFEQNARYTNTHLAKQAG